MSDRRYRQRVYEAYRDAYAPELEMDRADAAAVHAHFDAHYRPLLPPDKSAAIVDIGCGQGFFLEWLKERGYENIEGVDGSPQMAELAKKKGLAVSRADMMEYLRARPARFHCITASDVLEHFAKDELLDLLDAVFAALKPGGRLLVHTVNADGLVWGRVFYGDITHETAFTRYSLHQLLTTAGFRSLEFRAVTPTGAGARGWLRRRLFGGMRLVVSLLHHAESGSGILRNDHLVSSSLIAKGDKPG